MTENKELGTQFGVKGYPTLKYFKDGVAQVNQRVHVDTDDDGDSDDTNTNTNNDNIDTDNDNSDPELQEYTGGRTSDTILAWLKKKSAGIPSLATQVPTSKS